MKTNVVVSTRKSEDAPEQKTDLTIDWDGTSEQDMRAMAQSFLIVKWQGRARKSGIPAKVEVKASDYRVGSRTTMTPEQALAALLATPEGRAQVQAALAAKK